MILHTVIMLDYEDYFRSIGMGVTKAPFVNVYVSKMFDLAKVPVRHF